MHNKIWTGRIVWQLRFVVFSNDGNELTRTSRLLPPNQGQDALIKQCEFFMSFTLQRSKAARPTQSGPLDDPIRGVSTLPVGSRLAAGAKAYGRNAALDSLGPKGEIASSAPDGRVR